MKRGSSLWLKTKSPDLADFAWQNGYGIFSIGVSQIESVREYIAGQEKHHRKVSFQDELLAALKARSEKNMGRHQGLGWAIRLAKTFPRRISRRIPAHPAAK